MNLDNLSKWFYKALEQIGKLSPSERMTLTIVLVTVDHSKKQSECTYKTTPEYVAPPQVEWVTHA